MIIPHLKLFESFAENEVEYLLIGGILAIAYGVVRVTKDIDFFISNSLENAEKVLKSLESCGFGTASMISPRELAETEITIFKDRFRVDVLTKVLGIDSFEQAYRNREMIPLGNLSVSTLNFEDFIQSKIAAGRPGDLEDVEKLQKIRQKQAMEK